MEVKTTRQLIATNALLHDWLADIRDNQVRNNSVKNMEQDLSKAKDYRQAKTCPRCGLFSTSRQGQQSAALWSARSFEHSHRRET